MDTPCLLLHGPAPDAPPIPQTDDLDQFWWDVDWGLEYAMKRVENRACYGVALPFHWPDWGASTFAGVLGARMQMVGKETFWAYPVCERLEDVVEVEISPKNRFYQTVMEMTRRSAASRATTTSSPVTRWWASAISWRGFTARRGRGTLQRAPTSPHPAPACHPVGAGRRARACGAVVWADPPHPGRGKSVQVFARFDEIDDLVRAVGAHPQAGARWPADRLRRCNARTGGAATGEIPTGVLIVANLPPISNFFRQIPFRC